MNYFLIIQNKISAKPVRLKVVCTVHSLYYLLNVVTIIVTPNVFLNAIIVTPHVFLNANLCNNLLLIAIAGVVLLKITLLKIYIQYNKRKKKIEMYLNYGYASV